jgi:26S proteasome non-ATPase regulatory subunit 10
MEVDSENIKEKDLFKAAEEGDSSIFESLSPQSLSKSFSLTNEDARSLLHVAASSGHSKVPFSFSSKGSLPFSFNCIKNCSFLVFLSEP